MKAYKKDFAYSYAWGVFPTLELLKHQPDTAIRVFLSPQGSRNQGINQIKSLCAKHQIPTEAANLSADRSLPADCYAVGVFKKYETQLDSKSNHLVLVGPRDMGNLGAIIRTMVGFGYYDLALIKPASDIFDPKVVRSSMGALFQIKFEYFAQFSDYHAAHTRQLYPFATQAASELETVTYQSPHSLVFGNESSGLSPAVAKLGTPVKIPFNPAIDSLNLSVAVGIGLYHGTLDQHQDK